MKRLGLLQFQDNDPLMRALSKLINMNDPDLVLFVGEALVGNDGIDQLTKFNQVCKKLTKFPETGWGASCQWNRDFVIGPSFC